MKDAFALFCCTILLGTCLPARSQRTVTASATQIISSLGAKCLDIENGNVAANTRIILWNCGVGKPNQMFQLLVNGQIKAASAGLCIDDHGGLNRSMDQIELWPCTQSSTRWRMINGQFVSANNMCIDLRGGAQRWYLGNQDAILYACNGQPQQHFVLGIVLPADRGATGFTPGSQGSIVCHSGSCSFQVTAAGIVAQGGGNIVAQGGGNIVAQGGGNIVAQGDGNVLVPIGNDAH